MFEVLQKLCEIIIMEINQKHLTDPEGAAKMNSFLGFFIRDLLSILRSVK